MQAGRQAGAAVTKYGSVFVTNKTAYHLVTHHHHLTITLLYLITYLTHVFINTSI